MNHNVGENTGWREFEDYVKKTVESGTDMSIAVIAEYERCDDVIADVAAKTGGTAGTASVGGAAAAGGAAILGRKPINKRPIRFKSTVLVLRQIFSRTRTTRKGI